MGKSSENRKSAIKPRLILPTNGLPLRRRPRGLNASNLPRRRFLRLAAGAAALPAITPDARAQTYPMSPITMIVPYAAGGLADVVGRVVTERMREVLGQPIVIENVAGANGSIGVGRAARAAPDGYTIDFGFIGPHVLNGALYSLRYDVLNDFAPISTVITAPLALYARKNFPANDLNELISWLNANPNKASLGINSPGSYVVAALFQKESRTHFAFVPYRNSAVQDLMAGQIDLLVDTLVQLPLARTGTIKALALTGETRSARARRVGTADRHLFGLGRIFRA
jgi:tripartite-type tricarboxylate transporter receptor subunit TctC